MSEQKTLYEENANVEADIDEEDEIQRFKEHQVALKREFIRRFGAAQFCPNCWFVMPHQEGSLVNTCCGRKMNVERAYL